MNHDSSSYDQRKFIKIPKRTHANYVLILVKNFLWHPFVLLRCPVNY